MGRYVVILDLVNCITQISHQIHTVKVHNASAEHKTAEQLMALLEEVIVTVQDDWGAIVVAIATDVSGKCCKVQWLLGHKYP
jgi:hypothetical protein